MLAEKTKSTLLRPAYRASKAPGFALVSTVLLMVLLSILALGLLSLSSVALRSNAQSSALSEARGNAKLALMIAIGRLQSELGSDQRISANGAILENAATVEHPQWTGAWDSWVAGPVPDSVNPQYPSAESHHQTLDGPSDNSMRPDYGNKNDHFRSWLVSLSPGNASQLSSISTSLTSNLSPEKDDNSVTLVEDGSLGKDSSAEDHVTVPLVSRLSSDDSVTGRYGWWVGDESQKARIMADSYETNSTSLSQAEKVYRSQAPSAMGNSEISGLEGMTDQLQLDIIPSLRSLDLINVDPPLDADTPKISQRNFHDATPNSFGVMADVREGGLKRDLSAILERQIKLEDTGDEFMLYRFDDEGEDRVPIQDLSAYYQLYNENTDWEVSGAIGGVEHNADASRVMQVKVPDYGNDNDREKFLRQYTSLYRSPVPIKVQFVVGMGAKEITQAERDFTASKGKVLRGSDKYKMMLGVKPVVSLWNPSNLPLVMNTSASQIMKVSFPPFALRWKKYRNDGSPAEFQTNYLNLNYSISNESTGDGRARSLGPYIMQLQFARNSPIVFQPGEVKMFSIPINDANFLESGGSPTFGNRPLYQAEEFFPDGFYVTAKSSVPSGIDVPQLHTPNYSGYYLVFGDSDRIDLEIVPEAQSPRSRAISNANEVRGSGFHFWMSDSGFSTSRSAHFRNYQFISRFGGGDNPNSSPNFAFNQQLMLSGFPDGEAIAYEGMTNAIKGSDLIAATENGEAKALLNFFMMAGCEKHESNAGGAGAGRRTTTRPFVHGSILSAPQITDNSRSALYDYSWEWQVNKINSLDEAFHDDGNSRGFYGGGYTSEDGATHVVQQYLPALPPISIASLSSAHLGGFSLANAPVMSTADVDLTVGSPWTSGTVRDAPAAGDFRQVTATGQGGLAPHILQAIGNSYAHPNIPADKAFTTYTQLLNTDTDASDPPERTYADHSYLANKALWDEFFFSSVTPQLSAVPLYGGSGKTAVEIAEDFFFSDGLLPNRRFIPYTNNLSTDEFDVLKSQLDIYEDGFADKIASHLMVSGPFNVNSTSVDAWKVFFSSLNNKSVVHLENQASSLSSATPDGTISGPGMLANGEPIQSSALSADSNDPPEQWTSSRVLSELEIEELAAAMVEQVKKRGPFLSLSEFINRRLEDDSSDRGAALKGPLQAALDDESVSINAAFRTTGRRMDGEIGAMSAEFPEALQGPVAYGSTPYVDQADILRHMGSLLTPRGDTFVIRAYGDSLDTEGNVAARAWCEAVVQRTPDYVDAADDAHLKHSELASDANKQYGRQFRIIRFRWLNADEV
ncbi:MAG: hypothetical protein AB8D78_03155 [Akkermansiaceae bacterium]